MQRRIQQTNSYRQTVHNREQVNKVLLLIRQQTSQSFSAAFFIVGQNHRTHIGNTVCIKEHMFRTSQTDTFGTKVASLLGIFRRFGISTDFHRFDFVNPSHQLAEITRHFYLNSRNFAFNNLAFGTVQRYPVAFFNNNAGLCRHRFGLIINNNVGRTGNARRTHTACNNRRVRSHTAARCNNALRSMHTADIFRRSFVTDKDYFFTSASPFFSIFRIKYGTTYSSSWRSRKTGCDNFLFGFRIKHRVQQLV